MALVPSLHVGLEKQHGGLVAYKHVGLHTSLVWSDGVLLQILSPVFVNFPLFVF